MTAKQTVSFRLPILAGIAFLWTSVLPSTAALGAEDDLAQPASWSIPSSVEVRAQLDSFLKTETLDEVTQLKVDTLWPAEGGPQQPNELLDQVSATLTLVTPQALAVVTFCRQATSGTTPRAFPFLSDEKLHPFLRNNLRLFYGRWLAQHRFYDEAVEHLSGLEPPDVVDPAALLFYQGVSFHRLLDKEQCLPLVSKLLENDPEIPRRYSTLANLILADLGPLKVDSLDEISRMMDEINRRLALHRAGTRVRDQEDKVIEKLDKLIKKLEEQQQQSSSASSLQPSNPANDSMPMGGKGPGNVDPKHIGSESGWGNLPPKERQEALQQISKDLPAHYREIIEEYFRKLARESGG